MPPGLDLHDRFAFDRTPQEVRAQNEMRPSHPIAICTRRSQPKLKDSTLHILVLTRALLQPADLTVKNNNVGPRGPNFGSFCFVWPPFRHRRLRPGPSFPDALPCCALLLMSQPKTTHGSTVVSIDESTYSVRTDGDT